MPRTNRVAVGDTIYHALNRANGRQTIFSNDAEYQHFVDLLCDASDMIAMRILAYCIMPNHWHLVLYPRQDGDMGEYLRLVTTTHVRHRRVQTKTVGHGHLYQGTYKSFPVETDTYLVQLIRYVEQNPLRAKLVNRAEEWHWSSLWMREQGTQRKAFLAELPTDLPPDYLSWVNTLDKKETLEHIRHSVNKGKPLGSGEWTDRMIEEYGLQSTMRGVGRPRRG